MKKIFMILVAAVLFVSCSASADEVQSQVSEPEISSAPTDEELEPDSLNYLTGEYDLPEEMEGLRPISFMVNNLKAAQPQYGVAEADIVYEMPVEGGITRLLTIYADHSAITRVGSIRSARHNYLDIAAPYNTIFVHMGQSVFAKETIAERGLDTINANSERYAVIQDTELLQTRAVEHTFFVTQETLQTALETQQTVLENDNQPAFSFGEVGENVAQGEDCTHADVIFSTYTQAYFDYDEQTGLYTKGQYGAPQVDAVTGEAFAVRNVMVLFTDVSLIPNQTSGVVEIDLSAGEGYYISGGKITPILWEKGEYYEPLKLTNTDGSELTVNAGQSWICVVPDTQVGNFSYQ